MGPHENVLKSDFARLQWFSFIRHRVAHDNLDARHKFDLASMSLLGRRYRGSRPGAMLRDWTTLGGLPARWLRAVTEELCRLATQIAP